MASTLAPAELFNVEYGTKRIDTFIDKFEKEISFKMVGEFSVILNKDENNENNIKLMKAVRQAIHNKITAKIVTKNLDTAITAAIRTFKSKSPKFSGIRVRSREKKVEEFSLSNFAKTSEFGGIHGSNNTTKLKIEINTGKNNVGRNYKNNGVTVTTPTLFRSTEIHEKIFIDYINNQMKAGESRKITILTDKYDIVGAAKASDGTGRDVKADIVLIGKSGTDKKTSTAICFISHKKDYNFISYGGITAFTNYTIVKEFAKKVKEEIENTEKVKNNVIVDYYYSYVDIDATNKELLLKVVYGGSSSPNSGNHKVDYVFVGQPTIDFQENLKPSSQGGIYPSGDMSIFDGEGAPVLVAKRDPSAGRGITVDGIRINGWRFSISPKSFIKGRTDLKAKEIK